MRGKDALRGPPQRQLDVVPDREVNEDGRRLELAADPELGNLVLAERQEVRAVAEDHAAALRLHAARDDIEQGRLAGAVGADDDAQLAAVHEEVQSAQRLEAVVVHRDVFHVDDARRPGRRLGRRRRRHDVGRPSETLGVAAAGSARRETIRRARAPSRPSAPTTPSGKNRTAPMKRPPRNRSQRSG